MYGIRHLLLDRRSGTTLQVVLRESGKFERHPLDRRRSRQSMQRFYATATSSREGFSLESTAAPTVPDLAAAYSKLSMYADMGRAAEALHLLGHIKKRHKPDYKMYSAILKAFSNSGWPTVILRAEEFFHAIDNPDTLCYNHLLDIYARRGHVDECWMLVETMQSRYESGRNANCQPNIDTYTILLKALLTAGGENDMMVKAEEVFAKVDDPTTDCSNALLHIYAKLGQAEKATALLERMQTDIGIRAPNNSTIASVITALRNSNQADSAERAELLFKSVETPCADVYRAIMAVYVDAGRVSDAAAIASLLQLEVQNESPNGETESFDTLEPVTELVFFDELQALIDDDKVEEAETLLSSIDEWTTHHGPAYGLILKGYAKRETLAALGKMESLINHFETQSAIAAAKASILHFATYSHLLIAYVKVLGAKAVIPIQNTMSRMEDLAERYFNPSLEPNSTAYTCLMQARILEAAPGFEEEVQSLLNTCKSLPDFQISEESFLYAYSLAINAWGKSKREDAPMQAMAIFDSISNPDTVIYNTLMNVFAQRGDVHTAADILGRMKASGHCQPDATSYATAMNAFLHSHEPNRLEQAEQLLCQMDSPNTDLYNNLLSIYAKEGLVNDCVRLFESMQSKADSNLIDNYSCSIVLKALRDSNDRDALGKGMELFASSMPEPNIIVYNTYLSLLAKHGRAATALAVMNSMTCRPNNRTYNTVLDALCKSGDKDALRGAFILFEGMEQPDEYTYNTMMRICQNARRLDDVVALARRMLAAGCIPNDFTYRTVAKTFRRAGYANCEQCASKVLAGGSVA
jgi:pentatricopeptide repeat protein